VRERPSLRTGWLASCNVLRRWPLLWLIAALVLTACAALGHFASMGPGLALAAAEPILVAALSAAAFAIATLRRRKRLATQRPRDWLASLPSDLSLGARAATVPAVIWGGVALVVTAAAIGARLPVSVCGTLLAASAAGCLLASAVLAILSSLATRSSRSRRNGAPSRLTLPPSQFVLPPSRYAIVRRPRRTWASDPKLLPLAYWPTAQAKFWDRPKVRARTLILLLFALPLGVTGAVALAAAVVWLIVLHMVNLLLGLIRSAFAASWWLAPTAVGRLRFGAALAHRGLVAEIASCALLVGMSYAVGGAPAFHRALPPAVGWIGVACVLSATACLMALRTQSVARSVLHRWMH